MASSSAETDSLEGLTPKQQTFANHLLASGAVRFGAFRLKLHEQHPDAPLSPIYVNLRVLRSYPDALDAAVAVLADLIDARGLRCDRYADVPMVTPRAPKTHGLDGSIDGAYTLGETVLLIDDLVTHAESKLDAARVLEANGLRVRDVAVLIDREQGGPGQLAAAGYTLHAATRLSQLLAYFRRTGGIDEAQHAAVTAYFASASAEG